MKALLRTPESNNHKKSHLTLFVAALTLATAGVASTGLATASSGARSDDLTSSGAMLGKAAAFSSAFERVAESIEPSVVSIKSVSRLQPRASQQNVPLQFKGTPFERFFGEPFGQAEPQGPQQEFVQQGLGTGFIISEDGYVVTNNHVVKGADEVTVYLDDDTSYIASIVGTDPKTDLAVIKIDAEGLVPARLAERDELRVGSWVAAVGNPFGLSSTMTAGIVSAVGRSRVGLADYEDFIQTDAAINPGNSGGPLVNLQGEVVGINTAIFSRSGGYMGIGFAIPIEMATRIVNSLIDDGHVQRGFLGVIIQNMDKQLAQSFGYEGTNGALISDVSSDGPAAEAGLETGDIILRVGDKAIDNIDTLRMHIANTLPGATVPVEFLRGGVKRHLDVVVGELEQKDQLPSEVANAHGLGMQLETMNPMLAERLQLSTEQAGALVTLVDPISPASRAGIRLNDIILQVNGHEVRSVADFDSAIERADLAKGVRLTILTGNTKRFVFLRTEK